MSGNTRVSIFHRNKQVTALPFSLDHTVWGQSAKPQFLQYSFIRCISIRHLWRCGQYHKLLLFLSVAVSDWVKMWTCCYWMPAFVAWEEELGKTSQIQERKKIYPALVEVLLDFEAAYSAVPLCCAAAQQGQCQQQQVGQSSLRVGHPVPAATANRERIVSETGSNTQAGKGGRLSWQVPRASCSFPWCMRRQCTLLSPAHQSRVPYRQCWSL